jgi:hypothetical protein
MTTIIAVTVTTMVVVGSRPIPISIPIRARYVPLNPSPPDTSTEGKAENNCHSQNDQSNQLRHSVLLIKGEPLVDFGPIS